MQLLLVAAMATLSVGRSPAPPPLPGRLTASAPFDGASHERNGSFGWIRTIAAGPTGRKIQLEARTYLIDKQYQLPRGTELRGTGTVPGHRTVIKAVGKPYNACAGTASGPGSVQGRKGLLLGDNTYVSGMHMVGMETLRIDCLYAMIETPGCANSEGNFPAPPNETGPCGPAGRNLNCCGGYTGNDGNGVSNSTVEDVTVEGYTTQNMFFMPPTAASKRVSRDITVRNMRVNGTWADGVNIHGQHVNVMIEGSTVINSDDDAFAMWSIGAGQTNVTFRNNTAIRKAGNSCCFVNFGGQLSTFLDNRGENCGLTPKPGVPHGNEGLVVWGSPNKQVGLFGGAWNRSSVAVVRNMTGTCAGDDGCPLCVFISGYLYPDGFPGSSINPACNISLRHPAGAWKPAPSPLVTRWAKDVHPDQTPEYPRPMLRRPDTSWRHLNGLWQVDINATKLRSPPFNTTLPSQILVPYPPEAPLSGIRQLPAHCTMWYRRTFTGGICTGGGGRTLLHFEAVDQNATVYLNGRWIGSHVGGYDDFTFDVTAGIDGAESNELLVGVEDTTEGPHTASKPHGVNPGVRGKQRRSALINPGDITDFYTSTSGIWGTVWLECVPARASISTVIPMVLEDRSGFRIEVSVRMVTWAGLDDLDVQVTLSGKGLPRSCAPTTHQQRATSASTTTELQLAPLCRKLWSPSSPFLYDMNVAVLRSGSVVDSVTAYAGLRTYTVGDDGTGMIRPLLNGRFVYQMAILDQGFFPDGNYVAPTDAALKSDLETLKMLGFNAVRKHEKVEPRRWYYHADVLGLMVWQDMPGCPGHDSCDNTFPLQLRNIVQARRMHPSIVQWQTFNEADGMSTADFVGEMVSQVQSIDPTRPVDSASGGRDLCHTPPLNGQSCGKFGNFTDIHHYTTPAAPIDVNNWTARVNGEYGGILLDPHDLDPPRPSWSNGLCRGQGNASNAADLAEQFVKMSHNIAKLRDTQGLSASVYTQLTDCETECNGLLTYDRMLKLDVAGVKMVRSANDALTGGHDKVNI